MEKVPVNQYFPILGAVVIYFVLAIGGSAASAKQESIKSPVQLGPRPYYLVDQMTPGPLQRQLAACAAQRQTFHSSKFSIGHRGAPMQFPEHTRESYLAAARMGAGVLECDVTFTADRELVCRHSQCDLHTTTNIVDTELAKKCSIPPVLNSMGMLVNAAEIQCCTSDITLAEFKTLSGKMDAVDRSATTIEAYMGGVAEYRTTLYSGGSRGTLLSHAESIALFQSLDVDMTPELKVPQVPMPFQGDYTQVEYAQQMIDEYITAGVSPGRVRPQSFSFQDIEYWIDHVPEFGSQAIFLELRLSIDSNDPEEVASLSPSLPELAARGVKTVAPPLFMLLATEEKRIVPSAYARQATAAGLELIAWTTEASGKLENGGGGLSYSTVKDVIHNDGDILTVIHALARDVGIVALFSDWPATTTFYANCLPINQPARNPPLRTGSLRYGRR